MNIKKHLPWLGALLPMAMIAYWPKGVKKNVGGMTSVKSIRSMG